MEQYKVLENFFDGRTGKGYRTGDIYDGERTKELSTDGNRQGRPMIKKVVKRKTVTKEGE